MKKSRSSASTLPVTPTIGRLQPMSSQFLGGGGAVHAGHLEVHQDEVEVRQTLLLLKIKHLPRPLLRLHPHLLHTVHAIPSLRGVKPVFLQKPTENLAGEAGIVHHQHAGDGGDGGEVEGDGGGGGGEVVCVGGEAGGGGGDVNGFRFGGGVDGDEGGDDVGVDLGMRVGMYVGVDLGMRVGMYVGVDLGMRVGMYVGVDLGMRVGMYVGVDLGVLGMLREVGTEEPCITAALLGSSSCAAYLIISIWNKLLSG
eukprot:CAMPEP_0173227318 /NCGR_PEP_ID=MMETSP1142-20121109/5898_1 /TAXON_ID=483371 /ORGANISM="non described non described, Strain CCMP2298" /LENGTH=253 /DNA_ID=CAMNT_0014155823 /DNA_START=704 /DNA_END=1465 /DNA_ORIENTATION=+